MPPDAIELNDDNFESEAAKSPAPVLVCFTGKGCPPCELQDPIIDELARCYAGRLKVGTVEADENPETTRQHKIDYVPTLLMLKDGEEVHRETTFRTAEQLAGLIREKLQIE